MNICINYVDTVTIIDPQIDGYGTETFDEEYTVKGLFFQNTGYAHAANQGIIDSSAYIYIDHQDPFVIANWNRLEGMLVIANPFNSPEAEAWYRVIDVQIAQDKLLCNKIDNIVLTLKKTTAIDYVS